MTLQLPPLRERGTDVLLLARHYLDRACRRLRRAAEDARGRRGGGAAGVSVAGQRARARQPDGARGPAVGGEQVTAAALRLPRAPRDRLLPARVPARASMSRWRRSNARASRRRCTPPGGTSRALPRDWDCRGTRLRYRMERHGLTEAGDARVIAASARILAAAARERDRRRAMAAHARHVAPGAGARRRAAIAGARAHSCCSKRSRRRSRGFGGRIIELGACVRESGLRSRHRRGRGAPCRPRRVRRAARASAPRVTSPADAGANRPARRGDARRHGSTIASSSTPTRAARRSGCSTSCWPIDAGRADRGVRETKPFLERRFDVEPVARRPEPRRLWRVRVSSTSTATRAPFVARARELALLEDLFAQARRAVARRCCSSAILASASRVCCRSSIGAPAIAPAGCRVGGVVWPLVAVSSADRSAQARVLDQASDSEEVIGERIERATAAVRRGAPTVRSRFCDRCCRSIRATRAVAQLDPKLRRAGMFEAIGRFLLASSETRPLIVVLEDVHWMDQATAEFLALMVESVSPSRILLCVTHRTGYALPFAPSAFGTRLTLSRCRARDASAIACSLVGASALSRELQRLLDDEDGRQSVLRGGGPPIAAGERAARAAWRQDRAGAADGEDRCSRQRPGRDPGRLERLDRAAREMLRVAAVIGREFPRRVLERVITDATDGASTIASTRCYRPS